MRNWLQNGYNEDSPRDMSNSSAKKTLVIRLVTSRGEMLNRSRNSRASRLVTWAFWSMLACPSGWPQRPDLGEAAIQVFGTVFSQEWPVMPKRLLVYVRRSENLASTGSKSGTLPKSQPLNQPVDRAASDNCHRP